MRNSIFAIILSYLIILPALAFAGEAEEFTARVFWVVDGDTFKFEARTLNVKVEDTCRMLGYSAPEIKGKEKPQGLKARARLIKLIAHKEVRIKTSRKGKYGRLLCEVWQNGESVNDRMREYLKDYPGRDKYLYLEKAD